MIKYFSHLFNALTKIVQSSSKLKTMIHTNYCKEKLPQSFRSTLPIPTRDSGGKKLLGNLMQFILLRKNYILKI